MSNSEGYVLAGLPDNPARRLSQLVFTDTKRAFVSRQVAWTELKIYRISNITSQPCGAQPPAQNRHGAHRDIEEVHA